MTTKCGFWFFLIFELVLAPGAPAEKICIVHSSKEVHMGSSFQISCIFKKDCNKMIHQDEVLVNNKSSFNSTMAIMSIVNLTKHTTITCKCDDHVEPCGMDITPGYPPGVPQNLTCEQEGESGKVKCTWTMGLETYIRTTSNLWVHGTTLAVYPSDDKTTSGSFPILDKQTKFFVWVTANNSLGSANSSFLSISHNDIVKPLRPNITKVECSSRQCQLYADKAESIQLVEIQYGAGQEMQNTTFFNHTGSWTITSLSPYTRYTFKVRWKYKPTTGLWSEWNITWPTTDEEAPVRMLDAWYIEQSTQAVIRSSQLFWKDLSESEARGTILFYRISIVDKGNETTINITSTRSYKVPCSLCNVSIFAINSKGQSPPRVIQLQPISLLQLKVSHIYVNNHSVALSWPPSVNTVTEYLVEWYPVGRKEQLQWIRVKRHLNTVNITDLKPAECYEGAVIYLHLLGTAKAVFSGISTWQSAPQHGPDCYTSVMNEDVHVKWAEVPLEKRGGCLTKYTIYLEDLKGRKQNYSVLHPQRQYTISGLTPGQRYKLWVSAWTEAGEGPKGSEYHFIAKHSEGLLAEASLLLVLCTGFAFFLICLLRCACQFSSVYRRFSQCCHCLMPNIVPDPANSKWAKECASEKGEMNLQLHLSDSSLSEEEPDTVEVQEVPQEKLLQNETIPATGALNSVRDLDLQDRELCAPAAPYQSNITSSYLKSFSHESSFSNATQSTDITVDYISTHAVISGEEDNDEEVETMEVLGFFPCPQSPFLEPLISIGGKLTLDTVKIDCSNFLDCT
ncbi:interleukin-12 receptor subunit beta-2 [Electrophorus electricus]|uniref:Fibronectin type-III domain-containing protein n=1 Tax=Electrophorus electricus TaxID=8005 RepID=A0A4W4ERZ3_ELEEL|nr:interleukin-12 receptor subunit beta-2 [Electrophorus electricus]